MDIGFVGLGRMGANMARRLAHHAVAPGGASRARSVDPRA
jgi:3-hydroxyisobutyrate dehydrogenase-like beta-hydroxyacid dehydrogenase